MDEEFSIALTEGFMADKHPGEKPLLFISHKHDDNEVANALRKFVLTNTAGAVEVFPSSSEQAPV